MSWKRSPGAIAAVALLGLSTALAASPRLRVDMQVQREVREVDPSGEEVVRLEPVEAARVGDILVYTLEIVNEGSAPAVEARVLDPIPEGTVLIPETAVGDGTQVTYSADGGRSFATYPITRNGVRADGSEGDIHVPLEEYTHVRWTLMEPLTPGQVRIAQFKVRVE